MLLDASNPRSVAFQVARVRAGVARLPGADTPTVRRLLTRAGRGRGRPGRARRADPRVVVPAADRHRGALHRAPRRAGRAGRAAADPAAARRRRARRGLLLPTAGAPPDGLRLRRRPPAPSDGQEVGDDRRYAIEHRTTYSYDDDVTDSYGMVLSRPRDLADQRVLEHELWTDPGHADLGVHEDAEGNSATYFHVTEPHRRLTVGARQPRRVLGDRRAARRPAAPGSSACPGRGATCPRRRWLRSTPRRRRWWTSPRT